MIYLSKRSRTVSAEAKYDGQFLQEAKIGGLVYTLCLLKLRSYNMVSLAFVTRYCQGH